MESLASPPSSSRSETLLLQFVAVAACFLLYVVVPFVALHYAIPVDPHRDGPVMVNDFVLIVGLTLYAALLTVLFTGLVWLGGWLSRRSRMLPLIIPLGVFIVTTGCITHKFDDVSWASAGIFGGLMTLAYFVHWGAMLAAKGLPQQLYRLRGVHEPLPGVGAKTPQNPM